MEGNRKQYSEEFKKEAVEHSLTLEKTVEEIARDLGVAHSNLKKMACPISQKRRTCFSRQWQEKTHSPRRGD